MSAEGESGQLSNKAVVVADLDDLDTFVDCSMISQSHVIRSRRRSRENKSKQSRHKPSQPARVGQVLFKFVSTDPPPP